MSTLNMKLCTIRKRQQPANILVGVPVKGLRPLKFGALEQVPILVLVVLAYSHKILWDSSKYPKLGAVY